jgi:hypothetical protein
MAQHIVLNLLIDAMCYYLKQAKSNDQAWFHHVTSKWVIDEMDLEVLTK